MTRGRSLLNKEFPTVKNNASKAAMGRTIVPERRRPSTMRVKAKSRSLLSFIGERISAESQYLLIRQDERYLGIGIQNVREIIRSVSIMPLPESTLDTVGVINYRGRAIPVLSLWNLLYGEQPQVSAVMGIVIFEFSETMFGLLIEEVLDIRALKAEPRPDDLKDDVLWPLISGVAYEEELKKMIQVINPERLRRHPAVIANTGGGIEKSTER